MTDFFLSVYDCFSKRRGLLFALLFLLVVLFICFACRIRFQEDISRFLPGDGDNERINSAWQYVASSNAITVCCMPKEPAGTGREYPEDAAALQVEALDALAGRLLARMDTAHVKSLFYRVNPAEMQAIPAFVIANMPYFLDGDDYGRMDSLLTREAIARRMEANRRMLASPAGMLVRDNILSDPLQMAGPLVSRLQDFRTGDRYRLYDDHLFTEDGDALMFIECAVPASETAGNAAFLDSLKRYVAETEREFGGISFEYTGAAEIGLTNARRIRQDTVLSMSLAVAVMLALLIGSFRSGRRILLIFASVLFGGLFALALLYVIRGEVSVIAVGISSIMFGIAINYPLHFLERCRHVASPRIAIRDIIEPLTIGNITTVGAFMSLVFIGSDAMSDLGWFASLLLVGTILFVLFFLPHFLPARKDAGGCGVDASGERASVFSRLVARPFEENRRLVAAVILLTVFFGFFSGDSRFDTDMWRINYMTAAQRKTFDRMTGLLNGDRHVMYCVTEGAGLEEALRANERNMPALRALVDDGRISRVGGIGSFYPSRALQAERIRQWEAFWSTRRDSVMTYLREEARAAGFREDAFRAFGEMTGRRWTTVDMPHFAPLREAFAGNYIIEKEDGGTMIVNMLYTDRREVPSIEEMLNGRGSPSTVAFDAGSVTRRMIASLSDSFNYVLFVCGLIVFTFLTVSMGRVELSLIAFVPLALSWIWILGLMNIFDIRFNIVNVILATFIFGQGDDYTIFMTEGLMHEYTYGRKMLASHKKSIAMSALIMFAGMGMLILAKHPALRSLAEVTVVGMFSVVVMAYIFPPLLFRLLTVRRSGKRLMPVTLKNLLCTAGAFLFFLAASLAITAAGRVMFMSGRATERKKLRYHGILCRTARFVLRHIPQVRTAFRNLSGETFDRPGIIICNHQSHLDLMCVMMLTPKLIVLTNDWAWNSPFYGRLIRYADFLPVSDGLENALGSLRDAVARGYSIVIFPEGTRSADCSIRRFHRGAFYLAEQLGADLIPVMIHGAGHVLPKEEFMLRRGSIHIRLMPRITPADSRFRRDYSARSTDVRHYYQAEYRKLCRELETPDYHADRVIKNYIYKGPAVEREVRRALRRHDNYRAEIAAAPDHGAITVRNTGHGEYALLLALV
ncbi:MAG: 1-acyl-sn-glycerol-3-phosphate acyltransferase, partial [Tannerella sp.]|nr:1-acyl-sn-glycerol-3-phosphate acyltransferase [Tannerella sp.]